MANPSAPELIRRLAQEAVRPKKAESKSRLEGEEGDFSPPSPLLSSVIMPGGGGGQLHRGSAPSLHESLNAIPNPSQSSTPDTSRRAYDSQPQLPHDV
jgi:hypothetical protein